MLSRTIGRKALGSVVGWFARLRNNDRDRLLEVLRPVLQSDTRVGNPFFPSNTMVKSNIQNKSFATNAHFFFFFFSKIYNAVLIPLAPRLLLLVLVSLQTHSTLFLVPALELVNTFIPKDALMLVVLADVPPGVSQLLRTLGKHLLSPLLPLKRRKVKRRRSVLVPGHLLPLESFFFFFFGSKIYNVVLDRSPWQTIYNK